MLDGAIVVSGAVVVVVASELDTTPVVVVAASWAVAGSVSGASPSAFPSFTELVASVPSVSLSTTIRAEVVTGVDVGELPEPVLLGGSAVVPPQAAKDRAMKSPRASVRI